MCTALMWTRTGEPLNPHRLLARQEEGEVAVLARKENSWTEGDEQGDMAGHYTLSNHVSAIVLMCLGSI